jgi:hypothetical protein
MGSYYGDEFLVKNKLQITASLLCTDRHAMHYSGRKKCIPKIG